MTYDDHVKNMDRKDRCAWHESGHVLAAIKLGCEVARVELFPDRLIRGLDADGVTVFKNFDSLSRTDAIKILLAGPMSEKRAGSTTWQKNKDDFDRIECILHESGLDFKQIIVETERLIAQCWIRIELLQYELLFRGVMLEPDILEAVKSWREVEFEMRGTK